MKNEINQEYLSSYNNHTISSKFSPINNKLINKMYYSIYNNLNNFKLEYVIGKGGFGKVSKS